MNADEKQGPPSLSGAGGYTDPLGLRGLPKTLGGLDSLVEMMRWRLEVIGEVGLSGRRLVGELHLQDTRALRLLVAYARVRKRIHQIVGVPGSGYVWGDCDSTGDVYRHAMRQCRRMGRCYFYLWSLFRRKGIVAGMVQLAFDFATPPQAGKPAEDELAALIASEGVSVGDVVEGLVAELAKTQAGQETLATIGRKHADVLLPAETLREIAQGLDGLKAKILGAARQSA